MPRKVRARAKPGRVGRQRLMIVQGSICTAARAASREAGAETFTRLTALSPSS